MRKIKMSMEERFWNKVDKKGEDECWEWIGARRGSGYGEISRPGRTGEIVDTHRYSYELHHGPIPKGEEVCHTCNHPPCVNPKHLESGTHKKNMEQAVNDRLMKGNPVPGERRVNAKLTDDQVREIKQMINDGDKVRNIANHFSVSIGYVYDIRLERVWKHVKVDS